MAYVSKQSPARNSGMYAKRENCTKYFFLSDLWIMRFLDTAQMCVRLSDKYKEVVLKMRYVVLEEFNVNVRLTSVGLYPDAEPRTFTLYLMLVFASVSFVLFAFFL